MPYNFLNENPTKEKTAPTTALSSFNRCSDARAFKADTIDALFACLATVRKFAAHGGFDLMTSIDLLEV